MKPEVPPPPRKAFLYKRIVFRTPQEAPASRMPKEFLVEVEGVPHAGGIDVRFDNVVRTYWWGCIKHADRELPAEVGA